MKFSIFLCIPVLLSAPVLAQSGGLDLGTTGIAIPYTEQEPFSPIIVRDWLRSGMLYSSSANASTNPKYALGYRVNDYGLTVFAGQPVDPTTIVVAYTLAGDANLDGRVNTQDLNHFSGGFSKPNALWINGDFNYDASVNSQDFAFIAMNYGRAITVGAPPVFPASAVPEPLGAGVFVAAWVLTRRRRL